MPSKKYSCSLGGRGLLSGPYCEWQYRAEIVEGTFYNYTGPVTNGNRVYMKQFDRSASYHLMVMVEGGSVPVLTMYLLPDAGNYCY